MFKHIYVNSLKIFLREKNMFKKSITPPKKKKKKKKKK